MQAVAAFFDGIKGVLALTLMAVAPGLSLCYVRTVQETPPLPPGVRPFEIRVGQDNLRAEPLEGNGCCTQLCVVSGPSAMESLHSTPSGCVCAPTMSHYKIPCISTHMLDTSDMNCTLNRTCLGHVSHPKPAHYYKPGLVASCFPPKNRAGAGANSCGNIDHGLPHVHVP